MKIILSVISIVLAGFLLFEPKIAANAVGTAVSDCLEVIVPSLFAFTALAIFLQRSGLYRVALKPLSFPLSKLLRLDEELCSVLILANLGGYPVGVKLLSELRFAGRISDRDASRLMCCCFGSGPGFIIGVVGINVFDSAWAGFLLFISCFASSLIIAAAVRARGEITIKPAETQFTLNSVSFINSIISAAKTLFTVCTMIVGFSVITAFLNAVGVNRLFELFFGNSAIFPALLEVTRIKNVPFTAAAMPICAALLSFGGVCVLLQIKALSGEIKLKSFVISRAVAAVISAVIAFFLSGSVKAPQGTVYVIANPISPFSVNAVLSVCTLAMCGILLAETRKR